MDPYFADPANHALLWPAIASWAGTPFMQGKCRRGVGVDCVRFVREVYRDCGVDVSALDDLPPYSMSHGIQQERSMLLDWLHGNTEARERLKHVDNCPLDGDVLVIRRARSAHHVGIYYLGLCHHCGLSGVGAFGFSGESSALVYRLMT